MYGQRSNCKLWVTSDKNDANAFMSVNQIMGTLDNIASHKGWSWADNINNYLYRNILERSIIYIRTYTYLYFHTLLSPFLPSPSIPFPSLPSPSIPSPSLPSPSIPSPSLPSCLPLLFLPLPFLPFPSFPFYSFTFYSFPFYSIVFHCGEFYSIPTNLRYLNQIERTCQVQEGWAPSGMCTQDPLPLTQPICSLIGI